MHACAARVRRAKTGRERFDAGVCEGAVCGAHFRCPVGVALPGGEVPTNPSRRTLDVEAPDSRFFIALISGIAAHNTSQSQHLGRWSPPPRVVLCAGAGEGKGNPQGASSGTPHDPLPGFRSHVAPESAVGHPRSWSTAARLPPRSRRLWASVFLPVLRSYGRDFAVLAVPLVKELIAEAVIMQLGHSAPTARSTSTSRRQDVQA
jgi:hypothetical protein